MPEFTGHRDIRSYIRTIWRWKLLIVVLVVGAGAVAYLLERGKPEQYSSTATVNVSQASTSSSQISASSASLLSNMQAVAALVTTTPVAQRAGQLLTPPESADQALAGVSATAETTTTNFIDISVTAGSPDHAAAVANAFVQALRATLRSDSGDVRLIQAAQPDDTPVGPHPRRAVELGLVIGILLSVAAVMLLDSMDRRLRSPDELESLTDLPLLASFAPSAFRAELETSAVDEEAFQTLRTSLTYFSVDRKIKSVLVTSPGEQEGKSTVAVRLALASARAGLNVVLVDADLRRAGATAKLGLTSAVPLALVLADQRPVETALLDWPLGESDAGRLRVVAAGDPPPNPAALISAPQMVGLIKTLEDRVDLVIIDTPAALAVSDAVPLMQHVSGIVIVARMNRSSKETVRRLHKIIMSAHGHLLGIVATGVTAGPGYEKYSQSYYTQQPSRRRGRRRGRAAAGDAAGDRQQTKDSQQTGDKRPSGDADLKPVAEARPASDTGQSAAPSDAATSDAAPSAASRD